MTLGGVQMVSTQKLSEKGLSYGKGAAKSACFFSRRMPEFGVFIIMRKRSLRVTIGSADDILILRIVGQ